MSEALKKRVLKEYYEKKEAEKNKDKMENEIKEIVDKILENKDNEIDNKSNSTEHETDLSDEEAKFNNNKNKNIKDVDNNFAPYFYIDYDETGIEEAKKSNYYTLKVDRDGLTTTMFDRICNNEFCNLNNTNVIINLWRVLTKSNLSVFSYDCTTTDDKKFKKKVETTYKWGSKSYLKEHMKEPERDEYSLFRDDVVDFLKNLKSQNARIFIVSNSHYSFVKRILQHYKLDKYVDNVFTPSVCGLPNGRLTNLDTFKDGRKMNKGRMFVCIERYVGRQMYKSNIKN